MGSKEQQQHSTNPQTSLDLLATRSPFQRPGTAPTMMDDELQAAFDLNDLMPPDIGGTGGFMNPRTRPEDFYYDNPFFGSSPGDEDDMPFAVDSFGPPPTATAAAPTTTGSQVEKRSSGTSTAGGVVGSSLEAAAAAKSNLLLSSANGMASFCSAPPKRLALFDSVANSESGIGASNKATTTEDNMISSLANELAEFKSFGASLMMDHGKASQSSSNSTPISLRP